MPEREPLYCFDCKEEKDHLHSVTQPACVHPPSVSVCDECAAKRGVTIKE